MFYKFQCEVIIFYILKYNSKVWGAGILTCIWIFGFCNVVKTNSMEIGIYESLHDKLIVPLGYMMDWQISH